MATAMTGSIPTNWGGPEAPKADKRMADLEARVRWLENLVDGLMKRECRGGKP